MMSPGRVLLSGLAAALTWWLGIIAVFGPAQRILTDPARQSAKFLAAFTEPPLPRMAEHPAVLPGGLLCIGMIFALSYRQFGRKIAGSTWRRGLSFGVLAWALMVPWFEFYLPWNVMREPLPLVLVETSCWLLVLLAVSLITAWIQR